MKYNAKYENHPVYQRLMASGPKRILALDGGGIRGALSLGYLEEIENLLRERYGRNDLVLSDYFDLIGGTSTGSIIATLLALGNSVDEIKRMYFSLGKKIFTKRRHPFNWWVFKYLLSAEYQNKFLDEELDNELGGMTLGSEELLTGLAIFTKRADTLSIYNFHNHPMNSYYESNKDIYLKDLIRASASAPSYFRPKKISFPDGESAVFIDGGVSLVNNPSLMLFLMVTISGYGYEWKKGKDHLQIISVGTGSSNKKLQGKAKDKLSKRRSVDWASQLSDIFMVDASEHNQMLLQYFSKAHIPQKINSEAGTLENDLLTSEPLLDYCRYNLKLEPKKLVSLDFHLKDAAIKSLIRMDHGKNAELLYQIGKADAEKIVKAKHFTSAFDFGKVDKQDMILDQEKAKQLFYPLIKAHGKIYKKHLKIQAKQADKEKEIITITSDGIETKNVANAGDYIVINDTTTHERYVIKEEVFEKKYEFLKDAEDDWKIYSPKGKIEALELIDDYEAIQALPYRFHIIAAWGRSQYVNKGDFIAKPIDEDEVYRIGKDEFKQSYVLEDSFT